MRHSRTHRPWAPALVVFPILAAACGSDDADDVAGEATAVTADAATDETAAPEPDAPASGESIVVGDLAYFTGGFAPFGPSLAAQVDFPIEEVINLDPPLGRPFEVIHEDIGTVGEGQAARKLLESDGADILLSPAHEYFTYRDYILDWVAENDGPLMPTVHGGVIPVNVGGNGTEPIFRAQGLDEGQGVTAVLYAQEIGAKSIVLVTTPAAGFQLAADAIEKTAEKLGIEVLDRIDTQGEQASYRTEMQRAVDLAPDAIVVMAQGAEGGTMVKQTAEAGLSATFIGEAAWVEPVFFETAGADAIAFHERVAFPGFALQDNAAWAFFSELWDSKPTYAELSPADDFYAYTTYDLMITTALAIEQAGSVASSAWAPAMFEVTAAPGTQCFDYAECLALIRAGDDVDYEGVTGPATFSEGGVNAVTPAVRIFGDDGAVDDEVLVDSEVWLATLAEVAKPFEG